MQNENNYSVDNNPIQNQLDIMMEILEDNKDKFSVDESINIIKMIEQIPIKIGITNDIKFIFENGIQTNSDIDLF